MWGRSWPSMQGGFPPHRRKLRLQLRASQMKAAPGHTFWSNPVRLDALGGAAVVSVPSPMQGASAVAGARAAYMFAVTATQVPAPIQRPQREDRCSKCLLNGVYVKACLMW